jgi:glutamine amidotransferase
LAGAQVLVTDKTGEVLAADKVILPGVGAFRDGVKGLKQRNLTGAILESIKKGKYFLGICLGMQLLFEQSEESKDTRGLGILNGKVKKFSIKGFKVPHIGWNQINPFRNTEDLIREIKISNGVNFKNCKLLENIPWGANVYFCHSYYVEPEEKSIVVAITDYGEKFASVINQDNIFGMQFHPEKSQSVGLKILKNFVEL